MTSLPMRALAARATGAGEAPSAEHGQVSKAPPRGAELLRTSTQQLRLVGARVATYLEGSERIFLETGDTLHDLSTRSGRLIQASATATAAYTANAAPVQRLELDLRALGKGFAAMRSALGGSSSGLGRVVVGIDAVAAFGGEFDTFSVTLWALAVRTRIENARGAGDRSGFDTVADDVQRLARLVSQRFDAVIERAKALRTIAKGADAQAVAFLERDAERVEKELSATASQLASLRGMQASAETIGGHVAQGSQLISAQVMGILTTLQTHDVARQMLEHVRDALRTIEAPGRIGHDLEARLADTAALCRLQASQIAHAHTLLADALRQLSTQLASISTEASALGGEVTLLTELRPGTSVIKEIEKGIRGARGAIVQQSARERETASAMRQVREAMGELIEHSAAIKGLGSDMKLIAINAQVKAVSLGDSGRALAALASSTRGLSREIEQQIKLVDSAMMGVASAAASIDVGGAIGVGEVVNETVASMQSLMERLSMQHTELCGSLETIRAEGAALRHATERLSLRIAKHSEAVKALGRLGSDLERLEARVSVHVSPAAAEAASARIADLAPRYTMAEERSIHRAAVGGGGHGDDERGAEIELF